MVASITQLAAAGWQACEAAQGRATLPRWRTGHMRTVRPCMAVVHAALHSAGMYRLQDSAGVWVIKENPCHAVCREAKEAAAAAEKARQEQQEKKARKSSKNFKLISFGALPRPRAALPLRLAMPTTTSIPELAAPIIQE